MQTLLLRFRAITVLSGLGTKLSTKLTAIASALR